MDNQRVKQGIYEAISEFISLYPHSWYWNDNRAICVFTDELPVYPDPQIQV